MNMEVLEVGGLLVVTSASTPGAYYVVGLVDGACQCPSAAFRPGRACKHVKRASEWARATVAVRGKVAV